MESQEGTGVEVKKAIQIAVIEQPKQPEMLKSWALVELYGHARIVGWLTRNPPEMPDMVRVDVPDLMKDGKIERKGFTRYFGINALYAVTPINEQTMLAMLPNVSGVPGEARTFSMRDDW